MRCRYCSIRFSKESTVAPFTAACPTCARITEPVLVSQQGDGISSFRECMIRQNACDPRRKLLETQIIHFVIFLDDNGGIVGFDLEYRISANLFQWRKGRPPKFYGIENIGKSYHNRDEAYLNGRFDPKMVIAELNTCGHNIRSEVREVLLEGINAYH